MFRVTWLLENKMITLTVLLIFLGCFALYNTSKKALLTGKLSIEKQMQKNPNPTKILGAILLIVALCNAIINFSYTSGILYWLIITMMIFSLIIVLYPLQKINYKHLLVLFTVLFILEFLNH